MADDPQLLSETVSGVLGLGTVFGKRLGQLFKRGPAFRFYFGAFPGVPIQLHA